jgi:hypothetical protein
MEILKMAIVVGIILVVAAAGLSWWAFHQAGASVTATGPQGSPGQAPVTLNLPFEVKGDITCQTNGQPTYHNTEKPTNVTEVLYTFKLAGTKSCGPDNACKQERYLMTATETYHLDLNPKRAPQQDTADVGYIDCACVCPSPPTSSDCATDNAGLCPPDNPNCHHGVCRH